jgi:hypothetical protein
MDHLRPALFGRAQAVARALGSGAWIRRGLGAEVRFRCILLYGMWAAGLLGRTLSGFGRRAGCGGGCGCLLIFLLVLFRCYAGVK